MFSYTAWLLVAAGLGLLTVGGVSLVRGSARLATRCGVTPLVIGLTIVAFGTSSPGLFVSISAALAGRGDIAVGSVVGSAITNIGCILGLCAVILPVQVSVRILRIEVPVAVAAALIATVMLADGRLTQAEAALLVGGLVLYTMFIVRVARREQSLAIRDEYVSSLPRPMGTAKTELAFVLGGLLVLMLGARLMVDGASEIARAADVSDAVIGLTIVAIGTTLPGFATSLVAAFRRQPDIAIGTIIGSTIFTMLGILGCAGLAAPLRAHDLRGLDLGVMVGFTVLLLPFMKKGFRLQRWEGVLLFAGYIAYLAHLMRVPAAG